MDRLSKYDLHVHTKYSGDSPCKVESAIEAGKKKGLSGIAISDHDTTKGVKEARKISKNKNFLIVPGIEISSADGHILGLGIEKPIPSNLSASKTVELIRKTGGVAIATHPFCLDPKPFSPLKAEFDAIETLNPRRYIGNHLAKGYADRFDIPPFAGSDAHFHDEIGLAGVEVKCKPKTNEVLKKIKLGEASIFGRTLPLRSYLGKIPYKLFTSL